MDLYRNNTTKIKCVTFNSKFISLLYYSPDVRVMKPRRMMIKMGQVACRREMIKI
jgi:hypothetical protein